MNENENKTVNEKIKWSREIVPSSYIVAQKRDYEWIIRAESIPMRQNQTEMDFNHNNWKTGPQHSQRRTDKIDCFSDSAI